MLNLFFEIGKTCSVQIQQHELVRVCPVDCKDEDEVSNSIRVADIYLLPLCCLVVWSFAIYFVG